MDHKIINQDLIFLDQEFEDKKSIIKYIATQAKRIGYITDCEQFYQAVMKREKEIPTAVGYNIAIPHGKTDVTTKPFIAFLRTKKDFIWTKGHSDRVQLIFLIGVFETGSETLHLKFISNVSKRLLDEQFRNKLQVSTNKDDVFNLLNSIEV